MENPRLMVFFRIILQSDIDIYKEFTVINVYIALNWQFRPISVNENDLMIISVEVNSTWVLDSYYCQPFQPWFFCRKRVYELKIFQDDISFQNHFDCKQYVYKYVCTTFLSLSWPHKTKCLEYHNLYLYHDL